MSTPTRGPQPWEEACRAESPTMAPADTITECQVAPMLTEAEIDRLRPFRVAFRLNGTPWDATVTALTADDAIAAVLYAYRTTDARTIGAIHLDTVT